MNRTANPIVDILQFLLLLVFLPLVLLVLGPVLVISALFGRFSLGALKIRPGKFHPHGRLWALGLGLLVWGLTWGGLVWLWPSNLFQPAITPSPINTVAQNTVMPTHTPTNMPPTNTSTPAQPTQPATPTTAATATVTPLPTPTETAAPLPTLTPTLTVTPLPPTPTLTPTALLPTATPSSLEPDDAGLLLTIANDSLVQYLEGGAIDDLSTLEGLWAGEALPAIQSFGRQINLSYQQPLSVTYQLIGSPSVVPLAEDQVTVQIRELWVFEDVTQRQESLSDYDYTLQPIEGQWRIVAYQFQALPLPATAVPITNTGVITQTDDGP